eukprot:gene24052-30350_t
MQFGVNHIGHFLLTTELLDVIKRSGTVESPARIVSLSSVGTLHYETWERYGSSKLANILFVNELQRRFTANGGHVIAVSVHPGGIQETNLSRHMDPVVLAGLRSGGTYKYKTIQEGVSTTLFAALSPTVVPGAYYSDCQVETEKKSAWAEDLDLQTRLWAKSEEIVSRGGVDKK